MVRMVLIAEEAACPNLHVFRAIEEEWAILDVQSP